MASSYPNLQCGPNTDYYDSLSTLIDPERASLSSAAICSAVHTLASIVRRSLIFVHVGYMYRTPTGTCYALRYRYLQLPVLAEL